MNKPFNNRDRSRLKHLAEMVEQKRRDATGNGQGKSVACTRIAMEEDQERMSNSPRHPPDAGSGGEGEAES